MNEKQKQAIEKMYKKGLVNIQEIAEPMLEQYYELDIQQCRFVIEYLLADRDFTENYINDLERSKYMDYNLKFKKEKEDKGYWNTSVFADTDEEAIQKAERLKANGKYYSVILEKITYKYKTVKKWED